MFWNQKDLPQPPINTYKSSAHDLDLTKLRNTLLDGIKHFDGDDFLINETALLSRILYRMKTKFRSSKDFKFMEKLSRSLGIYLNADMGRHLKSILSLVPLEYAKEIYFPTKNMMSFILVKLQGLAKLMEKIYDTCLLVATELSNRLIIGHFWKMFLILFALVSRISILVKFNTKFICELYGKLLPHSYKLQNTGKNWLPDAYVLPLDLRSWLSVQWVFEEEFVDLTFEPANEIINFFNLVDDDDDDVLFCDEYILLDSEDKRIIKQFGQLPPIKKTLSRNRMRGFSARLIVNKDDAGEEITHIIELNDTVAKLENIEESTEDVLMSSGHKDNHLEDVGEEILFTDPNSITEYQRNKKPNSSRESEIILIPDTPQHIVRGTSIIVLDDSVTSENLFTNASKNTTKEKKGFKVDSRLKEELKGENQDQSQNTSKHTINDQTNVDVSTKRKLEFDEIVFNKKSKVMKEIVPQLPGSVIKRNEKRRKRNKQIAKEKTTTQILEPNALNQDSNTRASIVCPDQDVSSEVTPEAIKGNLVLSENVSQSPVEPEVKKKQKRQLARQNIRKKNDEQPYKTISKNAVMDVISQEQLTPNQNESEKKRKKKQKKEEQKQLQNDVTVEVVEENALKSTSNNDLSDDKIIIALGQEESFSKNAVGDMLSQEELKPSENKSGKKKKKKQKKEGQKQLQNEATVEVVEENANACVNRSTPNNDLNGDDKSLMCQEATFSKNAVADMTSQEQLKPNANKSSKKKKKQKKEEQKQLQKEAAVEVVEENALRSTSLSDGDGSIIIISGEESLSKNAVVDKISQQSNEKSDKKKRKREKKKKQQQHQNDTTVELVEENTIRITSNNDDVDENTARSISNIDDASIIFLDEEVPLSKKTPKALKEVLKLTGDEHEHKLPDSGKFDKKITRNLINSSRIASRLAILSKKRTHHKRREASKKV